MHISKIIRQGNSLVVTLPRKMLESAGLKLGDYVAMTLADYKITIEKVRFPRHETGRNKHRSD